MDNNTTYGRILWVTVWLAVLPAIPRILTILR